MHIWHFQSTYRFPFLPWPTDVTRRFDRNVFPRRQEVSSPEQGRRGLKPGLKPKHKRRKARGST
ncbi:TPA: hypothetical protein N0F65_001728 [Lagenidium giganteum]|uniref:Uncharacterized protein n=1 Tax=Lagenidium giganteum TaxID=4803 RepID=A0AAV2Z8Z5_9STRA|nr:TPA: hypothetical protein N0F65_001728 [Lagenidium giganteum]